MEYSITKGEIKKILSRSHTLKQAESLIDIHWKIQRHGYTIVKHLPQSSLFKHRDGLSWIEYWENHPSMQSHTIPTQCACCYKKGEMVGCHVYDIATKKVYIYPACRRCNSEVIGKEHLFPFYARTDLLLRFRAEVATCECHSKSPRELLNEILAELK